MSTKTNVPSDAYMIAEAKSGDPDAQSQLGDYREELEAKAVAGSELAALSLAKMYELGLGVPESKATMYAWLQFGEDFADHDIYPESHEELLDMRGWQALMLSDDVKDEAMEIKLTLMKKREQEQSESSK